MYQTANFNNGIELTQLKETNNIQAKKMPNLKSTHPRLSDYQADTAVNLNTQIYIILITNKSSQLRCSSTIRALMICLGSCFQ